MCIVCCCYLTTLWSFHRKKQAGLLTRSDLRRVVHTRGVKGGAKDGILHKARVLSCRPVELKVSLKRHTCLPSLSVLPFSQERGLSLLPMVEEVVVLGEVVVLPLWMLRLQNMR